MTLNDRRNWLKRLQNLIEEDSMLPRTLQMYESEYEHTLNKIQSLKESIYDDTQNNEDLR